MIKNHIIVWRPSGTLTIFGALAHTVYFHAKMEIESLRRNAMQPGTQHLFHPEPTTGHVSEAGFVPESWTMGTGVAAAGITEGSCLPEGDLLVEIRTERVKL